MPELFLATSVVGLAFVLNGRRSLRGPVFVVPAFFASWLTIELAPQLLTIHILVVLVFVWLGGAAAWPGWLALAISFFIGVSLWGLVREALRSQQILDEVLTAAIGPAAAHRRLVWKEFAFPFKLWSRRISRIRNVPYAEPRTRRYRLDVWHDRAQRRGRPCMLYVPGGAWVSLISNKNHQGKPLLIELAARGWVCFSMNYPVSPRATFPEHIVAVKRAIAWIKERAHEYGGDPSFLLVSGNSAGGHLASLAALTPNDPAYQPGFEDADTTVQAAAPLYGVYDLTGAMMEELRPALRRHKRAAIRHLERLVLKRRLQQDYEVFERASPWHRVGEHAPPFFVIHGAMDTLALVEEARGFVQRLRETSRGKVIYAELPRTQHAFDTFLSIRTLHAVRAIARFAEWAHDNHELSPAAAPEPRSDRERPGPTSAG